MKKGVFRNFTKFTGKRLCLRPVTVLKKRLWHRRFPVNFAKFLRAPLLSTSSPAHLFAIRGRRKRGPGTLQTRDENLPK